MAGKCANQWCPTPRHHEEGKLFRLDINVGSMTGADERRTEYLWLCSRCAQIMHPKVEVEGDTVRVRLSKKEPRPVLVPKPNELWQRAN